MEKIPAITSQPDVEMVDRQEIDNEEIERLNENLFSYTQKLIDLWPSLTEETLQTEDFLKVTNAGGIEKFVESQRKSFRESNATIENLFDLNSRLLNFLVYLFEQAKNSNQRDVSNKLTVLKPLTITPEIFDSESDKNKNDEFFRVGQSVKLAPWVFESTDPIAINLRKRLQGDLAIKETLLSKTVLVSNQKGENRKIEYNLLANILKDDSLGVNEIEIGNVVEVSREKLLLREDPGCNDDPFDKLLKDDFWKGDFQILGINQNQKVMVIDSNDETVSWINAEWFVAAREKSLVNKTLEKLSSLKKSPEDEDDGWDDEDDNDSVFKKLSSWFKKIFSKEKLALPSGIEKAVFKNSQAYREREPFAFSKHYTYRNPRTNQIERDEDITLDIEQALQESIAFYKKNNIDLQPDFAEQIREIWNNNFNQIQQDIEAHGFNQLLLIPPTPDLESLAAKTNPSTKDYWLGDAFKAGGGFAQAQSQHPNQTRICLTYQEKELDDHPELKVTLNKLGQDVNFDQALTLEEYLIFQKQFFDQTGQHLDVNKWTWLATKSGHRLVISDWNPGSDRLYVIAGDFEYRSGYLGVRSSRSYL